MKCTKCNHNEANCHYTVNHNGHVTEYHLCRQCAEEMGLEQKLFGSFDTMFDDMFRGFFPTPVFALARAASPRRELRTAAAAPSAPKTEVSGADPEMQKKRELNMLRRKMNLAAAEENFEEAARLRDQIRGLEGNPNA